MKQPMVYRSYGSYGGRGGCGSCGTSEKKLIYTLRNGSLRGYNRYNSTTAGSSELQGGGVFEGETVWVSICVE